MVATRLRLRIANEHGYARLDAGVIERLLAGLAGADAATYVTIESEAAAFCEGLDLGALPAAAADARATLERFAALLDAIETTPRPIVAVVGGAALGGGAGLAAAADVVIATPDATFGLPESLFGLIPAMVLPVIARRTGAARARWLAVGAHVVPAAEAWRLGLVDEVVDDLEAGLAPYARRFERLDTRSIGDLKTLAASLDRAPQGYREDGADRFCRLLASPQTRARIERFLAGGTPWPDGTDP
jgi:enoyl-CoA hydratase/carnithine racemase